MKQMAQLTKMKKRKKELIKILTYMYIREEVGGIPLRKEIASFDPIKSHDTEGQPVSARFILLLVSLTWGNVCTIIY